MAARIARFLALGLLFSAGGLSAQPAAFRVGAIDMFGGAVFVADSEPGVGFGGRVGLFEFFDRTVQAGVELEWWTAERSDLGIEVRDIIFGLAFLTELSRTGPLRPYLGLSAAFHSVDTSRLGGGRFVEGEPPAAARISGFRPGLTGFAGLALRLTRTGAIWLVVEYRYAAVSQVSHHSVRGGARLRASPR